MRTIGVDVASQPAKTSLCEVHWEAPHGSVAELILGVDDAAIGKRIASADKLGIDVPLGWPLTFVEALSQHSKDGSWPAAYRHADTTAVRFRRTDLWLQRELGLPPPDERWAALREGWIAVPCVGSLAGLATGQETDSSQAGSSPLGQRRAVSRLPGRPGAGRPSP